ncbi:hypothetical protein Mapa_009848 [Marchantia paleacea]|nr:hypothetical protein Mapa_009848 [Marchantia paleacea]
MMSTRYTRKAGTACLTRIHYSILLHEELPVVWLVLHRGTSGSSPAEVRMKERRKSHGHEIATTMTPWPCRRDPRWDWSCGFVIVLHVDRAEQSSQCRMFQTRFQVSLCVFPSDSMK